MQLHHEFTKKSRISYDQIRLNIPNTQHKDTI